MMYGKLLLVTNVTDLTTDDVVKRYKSLADIERGFHSLKSQTEIGPISHHLPGRIQAHALICFMALVLYRVTRTRLRAGETALSPEHALANLRRIQRHSVMLTGAQSVTGISSVSKEQNAILSALTIKPTLNTQLTLLWWSVSPPPLNQLLTRLTVELGKSSPSRQPTLLPRQNHKFAYSAFLRAECPFQKQPNSAQFRPHDPVFLQMQR